MTDSPTIQRWRQWADLVALVAGVAAVGLAMWPNLAADEGGSDVGVGSSAIACIVAGALAVIGVFRAQRSPGSARIPLALGGLLLILTPFVFGGAAGYVPTLQIICGVLMLAAAPFIGPMPDELPDRDAGRSRV